MKKTVSLLLALTGLILILAACSQKNESGHNDTGEAYVPRTDPVTISVFIDSGRTEALFMEQYGNAIVEKFPHVTIDYLSERGGASVLEQLILDGKQVDLFFTSIAQSPTLLDYGLAYDISDLIRKHNYDLTRLEPTTVEAQNILSGGGLYGLPVETSTMALFYNKDIFDQFSVPYPTTAMSWNELYEVARTLTRVESGVQYYGFTMSIPHMYRMNQFNATAIDISTNNPLHTSQNIIHFFDNFIRFFQLPGMENNTTPNVQSAQVNLFFRDRVSAMWAFVFHAVSYFQDPTMNADFVGLPAHNGVGAQSYPYYYYITSTNQHKDQSFEIISYLTENEFQYMKSRKGTLSILNDREVHRVFGQEVEFYQDKNTFGAIPEKFAPPSPIGQYSGIAEKHFIEAFMKVFRRESDRNTALREAAEATTAEIQTLEAGK